MIIYDLDSEELGEVEPTEEELEQIEGEQQFLEDGSLWNER